jgi:CubicO group peptidase (beta-lactamase class C family)
MSKWTQRLATALASVLAVAGGSFSSTAGSTAGASTKSLHPDGGGVPTVQTDASKFKNCQEPPGDALWEQAKPGEVGLDAAKLQAAADYYRDQLQATMRVYRFNCLVQTGAYDPVMERFLTHMFSTTKPTMTLVAGAAVRKGLLSVDDTVGKYFPDRGDDAHRAITVKQLLQHTSGTEMHWATELNESLPDTVDTFMSLKIVQKPGTYYQYSQVGCNMMSAIIEKAVGEKFQTFAQREVFDKIGILSGNYFWSKDRAGWSYGYSGLYLRPIDMVRIGTLMLQNGVYRGQRVVDAQFIKDMATGSEPNPGFGYNTWVNAAPHFVTVAINQRQEVNAPIIASAPHDMYFSWGWRGRHIFVIPSLGMVVTVTPFGGQMPCPGAICTFMNGYPGQGPGSGPGAQLDGNQVSQAEVSKGHHEFFRILMSAVADQKVLDPGPWDTPDDNNFDPDVFFGNPEGQMKSSGTGQKMDNYPAYFSDYAAVPGVYAKNMTTK